MHVSAETAGLEVQWNVRIRRNFVCAEIKWFRKREFCESAYVQILRELARNGLAAIIDNDPRGLYHGRGRLSIGKYYGKWKIERQKASYLAP